MSLLEILLAFGLAVTVFYGIYQQKSKNKNIEALVEEQKNILANAWGIQLRQLNDLESVEAIVAQQQNRLNFLEKQNKTLEEKLAKYHERDQEELVLRDRLTTLIRSRYNFATNNGLILTKDRCVGCRGSGAYSSGRCANCGGTGISRAVVADERKRRSDETDFLIEHIFDYIESKENPSYKAPKRMPINKDMYKKSPPRELVKYTGVLPEWRDKTEYYFWRDHGK